MERENKQKRGLPEDLARRNVHDFVVGSPKMSELEERNEG